MEQRSAMGGTAGAAEATGAAEAAGGAGAPGRLTTQQVAELLGVKVATVYAYASRGLLSSERVPGGKGSTFDAREVAALASGQRRRLPRTPVPVSVPVSESAPGSGAGSVQGLPPVEPVTVRTALTLIEDGRLYYRGVDAVRLAERCGFEAAVGWLWGVGEEGASGALAGAGAAPRGAAGVAVAAGGRAEGAVVADALAEDAVVLRAPEELVATLRRAGQVLPVAARLPDRLRVSAAVAATVDPLRFDLREENVRAMGAGLIAALVEALPAASGAESATAALPAGAARFPAATAGFPADASLAARLWTRLAPAAPAPGAVECLDRALVLLADHELAVSTVAARVAASARAHPYAVVSAGLGASDGPLHGAASALAYRMLGEVLAAGDVVPVVSEYLRTGVAIPGVGHRLYPQGGDPRARALLDAMRQLPGAEGVLAAVEAVVRAAGGPRARAGDAANVDLALAAFAHLSGMAAEAGEVVFSVARTAGWLAHAMEEYREAPLRMRARGVYVGPPVEQSD